MKFIEIAHPEGGTMLVHIDHITSAHFRRGQGDVKTRLGLDLDERINDLVLFGEDAELAWRALQDLNNGT